MSTMYIAEFQSIGKEVGIETQAAVVPPLAVQNITFTGTAGQSAALNANTTLVRITVDGIASIRFSTAGTAATTAYPRMAADTVEYFCVPQGSALIISAVTNT